MLDFIFIGGAPGTGKTTTAKLLQEKLNSPRLELSWIRGFHLDREWKNMTKQEEQMSFENILFILRNYIKYGYKNVIVNDFEDFRIKQLPELFHDAKYVIFSLILNDDEELRKRVLTESRDSGFRDFEKSVNWNKELKEREVLKNEIKIDNTNNTPEQTVQIILDHITKSGT